MFELEPHTYVDSHSHRSRSPRRLPFGDFLQDEGVTTKGVQRRELTFRSGRNSPKYYGAHYLCIPREQL
ncbi:hypothetical protein CYLTODRAFT_8577 [Cylindrobasidium torrendii FP15055 ss-10]|uniref:Uncharacterized protein n=1 Tax=Cylindrobasidium torrendii FP15055 ss-10 TaxID=1314674 RepID=A0A0D7BTA4_9AGAR|nr:hypothetical protein CYLTODRAFT_8577 [Cylindrobasidium torrendii FP15055 ss-10]